MSALPATGKFLLLQELSDLASLLNSPANSVWLLPTGTTSIIPPPLNFKVQDTASTTLRFPFTQFAGVKQQAAYNQRPP